MRKEEGREKGRETAEKRERERQTATTVSQASDKPWLVRLCLLAIEIIRAKIIS